MLADCGCLHPHYIDIETTHIHAQPCDFSEPDHMACVGGILNQFNRDLRRCNCNASCSEVAYDALSSASLWPSKQYAPEAKEYFENQGLKSAIDLIYVSVNFNTLNTRYVMREKVYEVSSRLRR